MIIDDIRSLNLPNTNTWIYEAEFGYDQINQYCSEIKNQGSVLEIGCGSGILLSILSEKFQDLNFEGIEPFGDGFNKLKTLNEIIKSKGIEIKRRDGEREKEWRAAPLLASPALTPLMYSAACAASHSDGSSAGASILAPVVFWRGAANVARHDQPIVTV